MQLALKTPIVQPDLTSPQFKANPYPFYARLREEAPAYRAKISRRESIWLLTRYDDVVTLLKDERFGKDRFKAMTTEQQSKMPWLPPVVRPLARNMLDMDPPDHTRLRSMVHKAFTPRLVEQLRGRMQTICDDLLDRVEKQGSMEVIRDYTSPLPTTIITEMLGIPPEDRPMFQRWSHKVVTIATSTDVLRVLPQLWLFLRYLRKLFDKRRVDPRDDLISALIQTEEAGDTLSQDELLAMVFLILIAGQETTVTLLANSIFELIRHPEEQEMLRRDPSLLKPALEEMLRYAGPVDIASERFTREDVTIAGVTIPRGEKVSPVITSANRDEAYFKNADILDITRDPNRHLGFGQGIHYCVGAPLARLEWMIAIETLLRRMPNLRLATSPESLQWRRGLFVRGLKTIPVSFK